MPRRCGAFFVFDLWLKLSLGENLSLVLINNLDPIHTHRSAARLAVLVPNLTEGEGLELFLESEHLGVVSLLLILFEHIVRKKKCVEESLLHISGTNNPCSNTVDRSVEVVESDEYSVESIVSYDLLSDLLGLVIKDNNVVGVI